MQFAMDSIAILFEEEHGISCDVTYASSGTLTTQIESGAPYDLFISANASYPARLFALKAGEKPFKYARGRLLFVFLKNKNFSNIEEVMRDASVRQIAIADDATAPYGIAAMSYLENAHLLEEVQPKLVMGESIGQVNQYIKTGVVDAAFTSYGFRIIFRDLYHYFEVDQRYFDPIEQKAMGLYGDDHKVSASAQKMIAFLKSAKSKAVLDYFGYLTD